MIRVVVADTAPIRYLAEIEHLDLLPQLFETIYIPAVVYRKLQQPATTPQVCGQLKSPPSWLKIVSTENAGDDPSLSTLDEGEKPLSCWAFTSRPI